MAEEVAGGSFAGEISGKVAGAGTLSGPLSFTVNAGKVTGGFSGTSSTGDTFSGKITGTCDGATGALTASYSGSFNRVLNGKNLGAVAMSGPFKGKFDGADFAGTWGGKGSGTWSVIAHGTPAAAPEETTSGEAVCIDVEGKFDKLKTTYGLPDNTTLEVALKFSLQQVKKYKGLSSNKTKDNTPEEVKKFGEEQKKFNDLFSMTTQLMNLDHKCKMSAIQNLKGR